ncbi:MAG: type II toxin-antitoxin system PemK/MazF family toxin [Mycobacterium sp.]|nr:type II toxin-antitoxin system PemK/MazF family toxin [Mycobacterium sp.]
MVISRADVYWADLGPPAGSRPAKRRPVLVVQSDPYNASRLATVLAVVITSNTALATMPGNVFLPAAATRLPRDSVVNITAIVTLNKADLTDRVGNIPSGLMHEVDRGLRRVLGLRSPTQSGEGTLKMVSSGNWSAASPTIDAATAFGPRGRLRDIPANV